jgi:hypothetical protein
MELSQVYYHNDFWNGDFVPDIDKILKIDTVDKKSKKYNNILHGKMKVDNGQDENEIYEVSLHPINKNSLIFNRIKKMFAIIDIEYITCIYNDKNYMVRKNTEYLSESKLTDFLREDFVISDCENVAKSKKEKVKYSSKYLTDVFIHLMRLNTAFLYLMGYSDISEDDFHVRHLYMNVYIPVTRCERNPSVHLNDRSSFPEEKFLKKWFKPNTISYNKFPSDKNKTSFEIFTEYVQLIRNKYEDLNILRSNFSDIIRHFDKSKIGYINVIFERLNSL